MSSMSPLKNNGVTIESVGAGIVDQQSALLDQTKRRIWCFGPHPDSKINFQRYYLPVRFLSVLRPKDLMILPGNHEPTQEFVNFMLPLLGLSSEQIIWTTGEHFALDEDINGSIQNQLRSIISSSTSSIFGSKWVFVPYSATKSFSRWSSIISEEFPMTTPFVRNEDDSKRNKCNHEESGDDKIIPTKKATLEVFGESEEWNEKYGHKGILHRHMSDLTKKAVIEEIDENYKKSTTVPKGYQCSNVRHLLDAYILLQKETNSIKAVIKPIFGTAGFGIIFINSVKELTEYAFPMGDVLLEEMLNLDFTDDGLVISPAVHYIGEKIFGGKLVDQLMRNTTYLGWRESKANIEFQNIVLDMTEKLIAYTKPKGPGGYDFLSVNGYPVLSDINTGRFNGAHQPKLFLSQYAHPNSMWYCWKHKPSASTTLETVWSALKAAGLAYIPILTSTSTPNGSDVEVDGSVGDSEKDRMEDKMPTVVKHVLDGVVKNIPGTGDEERKEQEGIFPLTYLRGIDGMLIAIAVSSERAYELFEKARDVLAALEINS